MAAHIFNTSDMQTLTRSSLITILWQAGDLHEDERYGTWDSFYSYIDATDGTAEWATNAIASFIANNQDDVAEYLKVRSVSDLAHDYWLTRNHHGAGFWDRGLGELGERLTTAAQLDREYYVFDDHVDDRNDARWAAE